MSTLKDGETYTYKISGEVVGFNDTKCKTNTHEYKITIDDTDFEIIDTYYYTENGKDLIKILANDNNKLRCFALYDAVYNNDSGKYENGDTISDPWVLIMSIYGSFSVLFLLL